MPVLPVFREKFIELWRLVAIISAFYLSSQLLALGETDSVTLVTMQEFSLPIGLGESPNDMDLFIRNLVSPGGHYPFWQFTREALPRKKGSPSHMRCRIVGEPTWASGAPLTVLDIRLSFEIAMAQRDRSGKMTAGKVTFEAGKEVQTFLFNNIENSDDFEQLLEGMFLVPQTLEGHFYNQRIGEYRKYLQVTNYTTRVEQSGLYLGPFWLKEFKFGEKLTLARHPGTIFSSAPNEVHIVLLPTANQIKTELTKNNIDRVLPFGMDLATAMNLEAWLVKENVNYQMLSSRSTIAERLLFAKNNRLLEDFDLRLALSLAMDREAINKSVYFGKAYTEEAADIEGLSLTNISSLEKGIELAGNLLDKLKWRRSAGKYRERNGQRLSFQIATNATSKQRKEMLDLLKSQWEKIGVELSVSVQPAGAFFQSIRQDSFPDMALLAFEEVAFNANFADRYAASRTPFLKGKRASKDPIENLLWLTLLHRPEFTIVKFDSKKNLMLTDLLTAQKNLGSIECSIH